MHAPIQPPSSPSLQADCKLQLSILQERMHAVSGTIKEGALALEDISGPVLTSTSDSAGDLLSELHALSALLEDGGLPSAVKSQAQQGLQAAMAKGNAVLAGLSQLQDGLSSVSELHGAALRKAEAPGGSSRQASLSWSDGGLPAGAAEAIRLQDEVNRYAPGQAVEGSGGCRFQGSDCLREHPARGSPSRPALPALPLLQGHRSTRGQPFC
jgi:hypothetical protein